MTEQMFPDEVLMAYADGELDAETARALEVGLQEDPALGQRLALFTGTRDALRRAAEQAPPDPVPDALMARVTATLAASRAAGADTVVPLPPRAPRPTPAARSWQPAALAASLALAVGLGAGFGLGRLDAPQDRAALDVALLDARGLVEALADLPSGARRDLPEGSLSIIASFEAGEGAFCREFELDGVAGGTIVSVACHAGGDWSTQFAVATAPRDGASFAPASSMDTLEAYLGAIEAGPPLSLEEERRLLDGLAD